MKPAFPLPLAKAMHSRLSAIFGCKIDFTEINVKAAKETWKNY